MNQEVEYRQGRFGGRHRTYPQVYRGVRDPNIAERMKVLSRRDLPEVSALDIDAEPVWDSLKIAMN